MQMVSLILIDEADISDDWQWLGVVDISQWKGKFIPPSGEEKA